VLTGITVIIYFCMCVTLNQRLNPLTILVLPVKSLDVQDMWTHSSRTCLSGHICKISHLCKRPMRYQCTNLLFYSSQKLLSYRSDQFRWACDLLSKIPCTVDNYIFFHINTVQFDCFALIAVYRYNSKSILVQPSSLSLQTTK